MKANDTTTIHSTTMLTCIHSVRDDDMYSFIQSTMMMTLMMMMLIMMRLTMMMLMISIIDTSRCSRCHARSRRASSSTSRHLTRAMDINCLSRRHPRPSRRRPSTSGGCSGTPTRARTRMRTRIRAFDSIRRTTSPLARRASHARALWMTTTRKRLERGTSRRARARVGRRGTRMRMNQHHQRHQHQHQHQRHQRHQRDLG